MKEDEMKEIDWGEAERKLNERQSRTVEVPFDFGDGTFISYTVRPLTSEEYERIEAIAEKMYTEEEVRKKKKGGRRRKVNLKSENETPITATIKTEYIMLGLIKWPKGWEKTHKKVQKLPRRIRGVLADTIDELSTLDVETHDGFRPVRAGPEDTS